MTNNTIANLLEIPKPSSNPKCTQQLVKCAECDKSFYRKLSRVKLNNYCSNPCRYIGSGKVNKKRLALISTRIHKQCVICNKDLFIRPSRQHNEGTYCSRRCMSIGYSQINININSYSRTKSGKRNDLNKFFRSRWEANYARYLNLLMTYKLIDSWKYENERFIFPPNSLNVNFYTPDFKVVEKGIIKFYEVKGWFDKKSEYRNYLMQIHYPNIEINFVEKTIYELIEKEFAELIPLWEYGRNK